MDGRPRLVLGCHLRGQRSVLNSPGGRIAAYPPLTWAGEQAGLDRRRRWRPLDHVVPLEGAQPQAAANVLVGLATSKVVAKPLAGLPRLRPRRRAAGSPSKTRAAFYASPLAPDLRHGRHLKCWTGWAQTPWDVFGLWASTVTPNLVAGRPFHPSCPVMASRVLELRAMRLATKSSQELTSAKS